MLRIWCSPAVLQVDISAIPSDQTPVQAGTNNRPPVACWFYETSKFCWLTCYDRTSFCRSVKCLACSLPQFNFRLRFNDIVCRMITVSDCTCASKWLRKFCLPARQSSGHICFIVNIFIKLSKRRTGTDTGADHPPVGFTAVQASLTHLSVVTAPINRSYFSSCPVSPICSGVMVSETAISRRNRSADAPLRR